MSDDPWRGPNRTCRHCAIETEYRRCPVCKGITEELEYEDAAMDWNLGFEHALTGALSADISDDYARGYRGGEIARERLKSEKLRSVFGGECVEALLRRAQAAEDALEKALPFLGSAATRSQIICGVDAGELYFVIDELLSKARGHQRN